MKTLLLLALLPVALAAGEVNKTLSIGDAAPAWKDLPGVDGKKHSLADHKDKPIVVLVFTCNDCACSQEYEERIVAFAKKHEGKVALVAVNVNAGADESLTAMQKRAKAKAFPFEYLRDDSQALAKAYGATYTPEFFVLDKERKIAFIGPFDDKTKAADATKSYLDNAVTAILKGDKPPVAELLARGCLIKYKRVRDEE